jgi:hypothetical protein
MGLRPRKTITRKLGKNRCLWRLAANNIGATANSGAKMRIAAWSIVGLAMVVGASSQQPAARAQPDAQVLKRAEIQRRAYELRPQRRDAPMRYINLSDNEMREVQEVASKHLSKTVLNVSPVIEGCPCEEGPMCTDQVYVVTHASGKPVGLQLSRVNKVWRVGVVQMWWLKYDALRAKVNAANYEKFLGAESDLFREFPICVGELVTPPVAGPVEGERKK